ncbi:MAG: hypothetical protein HY319_19705 [Armatimonadetes bacterium]|nr:hypothetical protein [Armatimonadota bacterium]
MTAYFRAAVRPFRYIRALLRANRQSPSDGTSKPRLLDRSVVLWARGSHGVYRLYAEQLSSESAVVSSTVALPPQERMVAELLIRGEPPVQFSARVLEAWKAGDLCHAALVLDCDAETAARIDAFVERRSRG